MAVLTPQQTNLTGLAPSFTAAAAGGDSFANSGHALVYVKNASAGAITVTINSPTQCNQGYNHNLSISVPAAGERVIGFLDRGRFNDASGNVSITYSASASVTVAVIEVPNA